MKTGTYIKQNTMVVAVKIKIISTVGEGMIDIYPWIKGKTILA